MGKRSSILVIESVTHSHAGNYTCNANNSAGDASYVAELQVNGYLTAILNFSMNYLL